MGWATTTVQVINKTTEHGKINIHRPAWKTTSAREAGVLP